MKLLDGQQLRSHGVIDNFAQGPLVETASQITDRSCGIGHRELADQGEVIEQKGAGLMTNYCA